MTQTLQIEGMTCDACVSHVTKALLRVPSVQSAEVDLRMGRAVVTHEVVTHENALLADLQSAVEAEGYTVKPL